MTAENDTERRKRLLYQSTRRGTKEADIIIGGFAQRHLASLEGEALDQFEALLSVPDPDLMRWINGQDDPAPPHQTPVWDLIMKYKNKE